MRARAAILVLGSSLALLAGAGCGHTQIATNHPGAQIYVDGALVGEGTAEIRRTGLPGSAHIRVEHDGVVQERTIQRSFTLTTAVVGLFTGYTGFLWAWQYPDMVFIPVETTASAGGDDGWGGQDDPWLNPRR